MSDKTKIDWTDATWNPVTGCTKVSAACKHCYAERDWIRLSANQHTRYYGRAFTDVQCHPELLGQPLRWTKPRRIFVNSMSDLFHEAVPDEFIDRVFAVMDWTSRHTFQVLTKRPERMRAYLADPERPWAIFRAQIAIDPEYMECSRRFLEECPVRWPLPNVWLGVTVENQETADERIPLLLQTPAAVRFVSCEPLLGPVSFRVPFDGAHVDALRGALPGIPRLDWVIVGGESGPKARPMHPDWVRSLRDQCQAAGVPFFFKQWGEFAPIGPVYPSEYGLPDESSDSYDLSDEFPRVGVLYRDGHFYNGIEWQPHINSGCHWIERVGKKSAGRLLDGRTWEEMPG